MDAPVMLEEFADFQCSACGTLHPTLDDLKDAFGSRLVIVFRQFPLVNAHANALNAARAAEAAGLQGKFWQMHDALFEHQEDWRDVADPKSLFDKYATKIGLDVGKFQADMSSQTVEQRIALDKERGRWIGVNSTPSVFLNGREVAIESLSPDTLRELINNELAAARK
jgi:protein-disulfide isomerase